MMTHDSKQIAIFGAAQDTGNLGVTALSQSIDEPSALVRFRGGVFKPGDAYGKSVDSYMHRAFVDVIWRF